MSLLLGILAAGGVACVAWAVDWLLWGRKERTG